MRVQGYIEIDYQVMNNEEYEAFNGVMSQYMIHFYRVDSGEKEYYFCILRDVGNIDPLLSLLSDRNPILNGLWSITGLPYGQTSVTTYDDDNVSTTTVSGDATYTFDLDLHLTHTPDEVTYDDGIETNTVVTTFKNLHGFAGWTQTSFY